MQITTVPIDSITHHEKNYRKHDDKMIEGSIKRLGIYTPLVVSKRTKKILVGHGRYDALKRLGYEEVNVIFRDVSETEELEILAVDNLASDRSKNDVDELESLLKELDDQFKDLVDFQFDIPEIKPENEIAEVSAEEKPKEQICKKGDVIHLGNSTIKIGEPIEFDDKVDCVFSCESDSDMIIQRELDQTFSGPATLFLFLGVQELFEVVPELTKNGMKIQSMVSWVKNKITAGETFGEQGEQIPVMSFDESVPIAAIGIPDEDNLFPSSKTGVSWHGGKGVSNVEFSDVDSKYRYPIKLLKKFMECCSNEDGVIFAPLVWDSAMLQAAFQINRRIFGSCIVKDADLICEQFEQATGLVPVINGKEISFYDNKEM